MVVGGEGESGRRRRAGERRGGASAGEIGQPDGAQIENFARDLAAGLASPFYLGGPSVRAVELISRPY